MRVTPGDEEKAWQQAVRMEREREQEQEHAKERSTVEKRARAERVDRLALEREVATRERQILTARQHESMQLDAMPPREARQLEQRQAPARWEGGGPQVLFRQQRLARPLQTWPTWQLHAWAVGDLTHTTCTRPGSLVHDQRRDVDPCGVAA